MSSPVSSSKRQRVLDDIMGAAPVDVDSAGLGGVYGDVDTEEEMVSMTYEEVTDVGYSACFACENVDAEALRSNPVYLNMMKLYTDNATAICKDAIYKLIKTYFDREVKPRLHDNRDWSLVCIKEHFTRHTMYPTDEILMQIRITSGLRHHVMNHLVRRNPSGTSVVFDGNNIKTLISLDKELRVLRQLKAEIPSMVGYDNLLNY
jgi:hypothetical protein